jgi:hypothetical protein
MAHFEPLVRTNSGFTLRCSCRDLQTDPLNWRHLWMRSLVMEPWRLTCVYGEAQVSELFKMWNLLNFFEVFIPVSVDVHW